MAGAVAPTAMALIWGKLAGAGSFQPHDVNAALHCKDCKHEAPYHDRCIRWLWTWSHKLDAPWKAGTQRKRANISLAAIGPIARAFADLPPGTEIKVQGHIGQRSVWVESWWLCTEDQARIELAQSII